MTINTESIRDAAEVLDTLTSQLPAGHPLRADADARAKSCVAALYSAADAIDAQTAEIAEARSQIDRWKKGAESAEDRAQVAADEIERLTKAQAWRDIETAPKDGTEVIVYHPEAGVCAAFCPAEGFAWHCMDGQNTVIGKKSGRSIPSMTSFINSPTYWMPLPPAPEGS